VARLPARRDLPEGDRADDAPVEADESAVAPVRTAPGVEAFGVAGGNSAADDGTVRVVADDGRQLRVILGRG
jgi:hypothetical protein